MSNGGYTVLHLACALAKGDAAALLVKTLIAGIASHQQNLAA